MKGSHRFLQKRLDKKIETLEFVHFIGIYKGLRVMSF